MITQKIADGINKTLDNFDQNKMYDNMLKHYKILLLIDENGNWTIPQMHKFSTELLPRDISEEKSKQFVNEMARLAEKNPYLMNFFEKAKDEKFEVLEQKVKSEGKTVLPDVVALANVLERLTKVMYEHPEILDKCTKFYDAERKKSDALKGKSLFHKVKFKSVDFPLKKVFLKAYKTGRVPKDALSFILPVNILEATILDYIRRYKDNGRTGLSLAVHRPGAKTYDPRTEAGPSGWSKDKKGIELGMPLPKQWADLYQTWNMAFCTGIKFFPYVLPKLFIPQVADYQQKPKEYIFKRAIALYLYITHTEFDEVKRRETKETWINWKDEKLTKLWGKCNLESTKMYEAELAARKKMHLIDNKYALKVNRKIVIPPKNPDIQKEIELIKNKLLSKTNEIGLENNFNKN